MLIVEHAGCLPDGQPTFARPHYLEHMPHLAAHGSCWTPDRSQAMPFRDGEAARRALDGIVPQAHWRAVQVDPVADLWLAEYLDPEYGLCSLCANTGLVPTCFKPNTTDRPRERIKLPCICPNGRARKRETERLVVIQDPETGEPTWAPPERSEWLAQMAEDYNGEA